jgi:Fe-S cluster biosynthesis and repair protein YggX
MSDSGPRLVDCVKLGQRLPGLDAPPWPGELGRRI